MRRLIWVILSFLLLPGLSGQEETQAPLEKVLGLGLSYGLNGYYDGRMSNTDILYSKGLSYLLQLEKQKKLYFRDLELDFYLLPGLQVSGNNFDFAGLNIYHSFLFPTRGIGLIKDKMKLFLGINYNLTGTVWGQFSPENEYETTRLSGMISPGITLASDLAITPWMALFISYKMSVWSFYTASYSSENVQLNDSGNHSFLDGYNSALKAGIGFRPIKLLEFRLGYRFYVQNHPETGPNYTSTSEAIYGSLRFHFDRKK